MRALNLACAFLVAAQAVKALTAQTLVVAGDNQVSLAQVLHFHPEGMIVSLPGARGQSLGQAIAAALDQEPAAALQLSSQELGLSQRVGIELQRLAGWSPDKPHWALIGQDKRVHAEGSEAPTAAQIVEAYRLSPLHTRAEMLREFLKLNGGQTDALARLILETRALAEHRTERLLGANSSASAWAPPPVKSGGKGDAQSPAQGDAAASATAQSTIPQVPALLSDEQDAQVWDEYAALYERFITDGHWLDFSPDGSGPMPLAGQLSDAAEHSPRLIALALSLLPEVEDHLRTRPSDEGRWQVWTSLRSATGEVRPSTVLQGLAPLPGTLRWPPAAALDAFVEEAERTGNWREAEPVLQASFDQNKEFLRSLEAAAQKDAGLHGNQAQGGAGGPSGARVEMGNYFGFGGWNGEVALLVEAKLRLGKTAEADQIFQEVYARVPKTATAENASALARKCGAAGLAEKWGRLAK